MAEAKQTWSGIAPSTLLSQIQSSVPFLWSELGKAQTPSRRYLQVLADWDAGLWGNIPGHFEYFQLCLVAHFSTVGSFVPTDVDNQIRHKIWATAPNLAVKQKMADLVSEFPRWDIEPVAGRFVRSPTDGAYLSGLDGEWLGCAVAAYASLRKSDAERARSLCEAIVENLDKTKRIYLEFVRAHDGIALMKTIALIAHNLGDLDRVIELWKLSDRDPLRIAAYKVGSEANARFGDIFFIAGNIYKRFLAIENHRQFPLREPKALRKKHSYLPPIAPFFDDWGELLALDPDLEERDLAEILEVLIKGFLRLDGPVGYARALAGFESRYRGGLKAALRLLPARMGKEWTSGRLRTECSLSKERFLEKWASYPFDKKNHLPLS